MPLMPVHMFVILQSDGTASMTMTQSFDRTSNKFNSFQFNWYSLVFKPLILCAKFIIFCVWLYASLNCTQRFGFFFTRHCIYLHHHNVRGIVKNHLKSCCHSLLFTHMPPKNACHFFAWKIFLFHFIAIVVCETNALHPINFCANKKNRMYLMALISYLWHFKF